MESLLKYILVVSTVPFLFILIIIYNKLSTGWCRSQKCLVDKTAIVTGSNTGIGYETAKDFAKRGAKVILACRNDSKAKAAQKRIIEETGNCNIFVKLLDLSSLESVRNFAEEINKSEKSLDILVNNAGGIGIEDTSVNGQLLLMQVNYFGPFLLTNLLLDLMIKSGPSRIVNVSSVLAHFGILDVENLGESHEIPRVYATTKLCNILFTKQLAKKIENTQVSAFSVNPGAISTDVWRSVQGYYKIILNFVRKYFFKNCEEGAQTTIYAATEKGIEKFNGEHFYECKRVQTYGIVKRYESKSEQLWNKTEEIVGMKKSL